MITRSTLGIMAALLASSVHAAVPRVTIDRAAQKRLGIATAPLAAATVQPSLTSFGHVLDPTPLMTLDSDLETAVASAAASSAEARRTHELAAADATVARKVAEAAAAQARGDSARLLLLRRRLTLEWGAAIAALPDRRRAALLADLAAGRSALLRVDTPIGAGSRAATSATIDLGDQGSGLARFVGDTRAADPRQAVAGRLAIVSGRIAGLMAIGLTVPVRIAVGPPSPGIFVPAAALLRHGGKTWVYIRTADTAFERRLLGDAAPRPLGLLVHSGVRSGEAVVVHGGAQLFTAEQASVAGAE